MDEGTEHASRAIGRAGLKPDLSLQQSITYIPIVLSLLPKSNGCVTAAAQQEAEPPNQKG
ncbi:MAG: hypothetical protein Q9199_007614 [Rusavskia elegans]